jgi:hypothetical protein
MIVFVNFIGELIIHYDKNEQKHEITEKIVQLFYGLSESLSSIMLYLCRHFPDL